MDKIRTHQPETIITECLSCRLQFQHPVEVLRSALYNGSQQESRSK